jgi:hypothetical protein
MAYCGVTFAPAAPGGRGRPHTPSAGRRADAIAAAA